MIITTTSSVEGKKIIRYLGVIAGEAAIGSSLFDDLFKSIKGIVTSRTTRFENDLMNARNLALKELEKNAAGLGANAVVGVDLDYEVLGAGELMVMVIANGTAVEVA